MSFKRHIQVAGDGNCMANAILIQLGWNADPDCSVQSYVPEEAGCEALADQLGQVREGDYKGYHYAIW